MSRQEIHTRIHFYSAVLFAFTLPIAKMMQLFIIFLLLNWIIEGDFKNKFRTITQNKFALLFVVFYLIHILGLAYTENMYAGLFDVQIKLTMLFFPVIFCSRPISKENLKFIFYAFIAGAIVCVLFMVGIAIFTFLNKGENHFLYEAFSFWIHPSYLAMYLNFGIVWIMFDILKNDGNPKFIPKIWSFLIVLFFSFIIVLLSSKMGLITMMLIHFCFLVYYIFSGKKYIFGLACIMLIFLSYWGIKRFIPEVIWRVDTAIDAMFNSKTNNEALESTAVRMLVWNASNEVIKNNWIVGVGTGDAKDELMKEYNVEGMKGAFDNCLNCHNEFYQITVTLGVVALFILLLHLFLPLIDSLRKKNIIYFLFLIIIIINFLPESMLETQAGVMFFAFFNSILCFSFNNQQPTTNNQIE